MSTFVNCTDPGVFRLLLPLTNSDWRSSTGRRCCFSRLPWPGALAASNGFTSTSSRMILRNTPDLVEPQIIMTSSQNTCRINSLGVAVANDVNAAEIFASNPRESDFSRILLCSGTNSVESTSFCWRKYSSQRILNNIFTSLSVHLRYFTSLTYVIYLLFSYFFALNLNTTTWQIIFMQNSRMIIWCLSRLSTLKRNHRFPNSFNGQRHRIFIFHSISYCGAT